MDSQEVGLYIHVPFCKIKCSYCDFNSYAGLEHLIPEFIVALLLELKSWHSVQPIIKSIYFGGGTPSLFPAEHIQTIIEACRTYFQLTERAEITLEANPGTITSEYLSDIKDKGINRLSLGVQSFDDNYLKVLGRLHNACEARLAYLQARKAGFDNINIDLIYGISYQSLGQWRESLEDALKLRPEHLSLYSLTVEEGTPLYEQIKLNIVPSPDPDIAAEMYSMAEEVLARKGYEHYEISNWCLPGKECQHNINYWKNGPYIGIGAGAHSCFNHERFWNVAHPLEYIQRIIGEGKAIAGKEYISPELERAEYIILGLRLIQGPDLREFKQRYGLKLKEVYSEEISCLKSAGLLEEINDNLRLTPRGRLLGNEVFQQFLPLSSAKDYG